MTTTASTPAAPGASSALNPKLIVPFVNSARNVLRTMAGIDTTVQRPHVRVSAVPEKYDVSGVIGFSGEIVGSVVVRFQQDAALRIVSALAGTTLALEGRAFSDAVGEFANMIAGGAKTDLGFADASITVPNVIIGAGHSIACMGDVPCIVIPCVTTIGEFAVEVNLKQVLKTH